MTANRQKQDGFTFVEILLVVVLLGVVAGLSVPHFSQSYKTLQVQNVADHIAYLMRYAQSRAIMKNGFVRLVFNASSHTYWLEQAQASGDEAEMYYERIPGRWGRVFSFDPGMELSAESSFVVCYPDGKDSLSIRHGAEPEIALHIEHKGGLWGIDGDRTGSIAVFGYFPSVFSIIQGRYMKNVNTRVESGPHSGRFKGYSYAVIGGFFLVPKEVEEIFFKVKAPSHTGKYEAIFVVASEHKTYVTQKLELIIT